MAKAQSGVNGVWEGGQVTAGVAEKGRPKAVGQSRSLDLWPEGG